MKTVIVVGPQGCGKTRHVESLRAHFGCTNIVDCWTVGQDLRPGALHLNHQAMEAVRSVHPEATVVDFADALCEVA